jgi:hypothetical protein
MLKYDKIAFFKHKKETVLNLSSRSYCKAYHTQLSQLGYFPLVEIARFNEG